MMRLEPTAAAAAAAIQLSRCDASVRHLYILMDMPIPFRVGEVALLGRQFLGTPAIWAEGFIHVPLVCPNDSCHCVAARALAAYY